MASNPPPALPGFLNVVAPYLEHYSYGAVLLLVMLEDFGIPVPGETILIAAAIFAGAGRLNIVLVGVVGFIAAIIGDNIGFAIGHFGGRALALRWGRYVFLTEERLDKAASYFDRHGGKIIVIARFVEGLRQANGIIAGISGMHWRRFVFFNAIGAALWVGTWVSLGYLAGNHISTIYHYITTYSYYALIAAAVLLAAFIARRVLRRRLRSRLRTAHEAQEKLEDTPGTPEASGAIGVHVAQENIKAQQNSGAQEDAEVQQDTEVQEDSEVQEDAEVQKDIEIQVGIVAGESSASQKSADPQENADPQESAGPQGAQEGAGSQSS